MLPTPPAYGGVRRGCADRATPARAPAPLCEQQAGHGGAGGRTCTGRQKMHEEAATVTPAEVPQWWRNQDQDQDQDQDLGAWSPTTPTFVSMQSALEFKDLACTKYLPAGRTRSSTPRRTSRSFRCASYCGGRLCPAGLRFSHEMQSGGLAVVMSTTGRHNTDNGEGGRGWYFCRRFVLEHAWDSPGSIRKKLEWCYPPGNPHHEALPTAATLRDFKKALKRASAKRRNGLGSICGRVHSIPRWAFGVTPSGPCAGETGSVLPPGATPRREWQPPAVAALANSGARAAADTPGDGSRAPGPSVRPGRAAGATATGPQREQRSLRHTQVVREELKALYHEKMAHCTDA